eukprot:1089921-Amphidinium_carterae.1
MSDTGVLLTASHCTHSGLLVQASLLAWTTASGVVWELRRFLAPAGFKETKGLPLKEHVRRNFPVWQSYLRYLQLPEASLVRSVKSLIARGVAMDAVGEASQEHQVTTVGMLALLLHWCHHRKSKDDKDKAVALLKGVLMQALPPHDLDGLLDMSPQRPHVEVACSDGAVTGGPCTCWKRFLVSLSERPEQDSPQLAVACVLLLASEPTRTVCVAVRSRLTDVLLHAATLIDGAYGHWGESSWQKSASASVQGQHKQRRISAQVKQWITQSVSAGRFMSGEEAMTTLECTSASSYKNWRASDLVALRLKLHEHMHTCRNLSIAVDATRLGRPAQEWLFAATSLLDLDVHCNLPPQVFLLEAHVLLWK